MTYLLTSDHEGAKRQRLQTVKLVLVELPKLYTTTVTLRTSPSTFIGNVSFLLTKKNIAAQIRKVQ